ncbi:uncharacterized protein N7482_007782 [Penicillium canariense]|uniref:Anaphase-promoting complex subunit 2 n=1 Tax=Penicillium canariense TaxID=189055 RepID=A0A9W9HXI9_9EURO|nr:uncharacterized protein N7482_007782 [Penicillium canariense]KAJ5160778.1 hypothetical protein N7482_007782 [Penicillium canariense]
MISTYPLNAGRQRVFGSVFSPASLEARPPLASSLGSDQTPLASFQPNSSFSTVKTGSFTSLQHEQSAAAPLDREKWDQAWSASTAFLAVPNQGFAPIYEARETDGSEALKEWSRLSPPSKETAEALSYLTAAAQQGSTSLGATTPKNLFDWYGDEIRRHFLTNLRSGLYKLLKNPEKEGLLRTIVDCLQLARRIYLAPVVHYLLPLLPTREQGRVLTQLQRAFHTVASHSLPWSTISPLLGGELAKDSLIILGIDTLIEQSREDESSQDGMEVDRQYSVSYEDWKNETSEVQAQMMTEGENGRVTMARDRLLAFLNGLQLVGLGGDKAQKVFASVMNLMMTEFVRAAYTRQWETPTAVPQHLQHWIENVFARLAVQVLAIIHTPAPGSQSPGSLDVSFGDVERWQEIGIARLGALRTSELFDIIVEWPASSGAVEDLRHFTTHPAARAHVTQSFIAILNQRLLHPGASTVEILQLYISIIRAFHLLDPKGVLLDRIARPIRRYLRGRDDTVKVIVGGLLAEPATADAAALPSTNDTLVELSTELSKAHQLSLQNNTSELDWDDMNWVPDPIDAATDYRKSKSSDVIDSLVSLFDSKETFVKELQTLLSDRLLQKREDYDQEISVLELLKVRFGDSALQACEVMLRDISDSRRVDAVVRNDQGLSKPPARIHAKRPLNQPLPELHAKILSRFFWPEIQDQEFKVPDEIASLQDRYSAGFEALKASRKLTWRNGLGQATVELELSDRSFSEEVTTWQATVIYAFQSTDDDNVTRTVSYLAEQLHMAATLVRSACLFWVSKRILVESSRDTFRVLECLPTDDEMEADASGHNSGAADLQSGAVSNAAAAAAEAAAMAAAKETAEAAAMEKMNLYWQFIVGMLTNQGAMPLQRIVMMLKIVVPGGFPFSNEELREFLAGMVSRKKLEIVSGGNYKLVH